MKIRTIIFAAAMLFAFVSFGQFTFSVSPGLQINGASFGYKMNKVVPFAGIQVYNGSMKLTDKWKSFDYDLYQMVDMTDSYDVSATAIMPTIGVKYFFLEKNKLKAYGTASFTDILISGKIEETDINGSDEYNLKDDLKKGFFYTTNLGFGTEYFFDDNFSIGGEFGFRMIHASYEFEYDAEVYDPVIDDYTQYKETYTVKQSLNPTYVKLSLNFYF